MGILGFEQAKNYLLIANPTEEPFRWLQVQVWSPSPEATLGIVGTGRRLGISTMIRVTSGREHVDATADDGLTLLQLVGADQTVAAWQSSFGARG